MNEWIYEPYYGRSVYVQLTKDEIAFAIEHGKLKHAESLRQKLKNRYGCNFTPTESLFNTCISEITETGAALALGWPVQLTVNTFGVADLPGNISVKSIKRNEDGLVIRDGDCNDWRQVGVGIDMTGMFTVDDLYNYDKPLRIVGWIGVRAAKYLVDHVHREWRNDYGRPDRNSLVTRIPQQVLCGLPDLCTLLALENLETNASRLIPGRTQ